MKGKSNKTKGKLKEIKSIIKGIGRKNKENEMGFKEKINENSRNLKGKLKKIKRKIKGDGCCEIRFPPKK